MLRNLSLLKSLWLIFFLCLGLSVQARIGETSAQLQVRFKGFGKVGPEGSRIYRSNDLEITVFFIDGISQAEILVKKPTQDETGLGLHGDEFSEHEIGLLLEANGNGQTWTQPKHNHWTRADNLVLVLYDTFYIGQGSSGPRVMIYSARYAQSLEKTKDRQNADKRSEEKRREDERLKDY